MKILAIDLGKVKSVACDYESETAAHRFETVRTEPAILEDLFRRRCPDRVVIEFLQPCRFGSGLGHGPGGADGD